MQPPCSLTALVVCCAALAAACGAPTTASQPAKAPATGEQVPGTAAPLEAEEAAATGLPVLRTGELSPLVHPTVLEGRVTARHLGPRDEVLKLDVSLPPRTSLRGAVVTVDGANDQRRPLAFVSLHDAGRGGAASVWIRRARAEAGQPVRGAIYTAANVHARSGEPGRQLDFRATGATATPPDPQVQTQWADALANRLVGQDGFWPAPTPWHSFARRRLQRVFAGKSPAGPARPAADRGAGASELAQLMATTTGMTSLQETFQLHRPVLVAAARQPRTIAIRTVRGPQLEAHPFQAMLRALGRTAPPEPLARATPADFYFVRFRSMDTFFSLLDEVDAWATPAARLLDGRSNERGLAKRYEAQLGLGRGPITRMLGPEVIESIALVGSDPYVREGTDLTVIFAVKSHRLFDAGVVRALGKHEKHHGALERSTRRHGAVEVHAARSNDGRVRQHRAQVGKLQLVSNSPTAIRRVLDAIAGKGARLSDEADFQYMLARDATVADDVLGFAGDRFVAEVVGPRQKILEARRQLALAELLTPGFAALLHGWVFGASPTTGQELLATRLLEPAELKHSDGSAMSWQPGRAARSAWGSPEALTPLIDLPAPQRISKAEREAYRIFSDGYQANFATFIDPILLKLKASDPGGPGAATTKGRTLTAHLRILPLIDVSEYREIAELVGEARVSAPPLLDGARAVLGIGRKARLRRELSGVLSEVAPLGRRFKLDWLGDWAMVGSADHPALARGVRKLQGNALPQRPASEPEADEEREEELAILRRTPAYVAIDLRSTATAALALVAARQQAEKAAPGMIRWEELESYRKISIVQIAVREDGGRNDEGGGAADIEIYYAICSGILLVSLRADVMRKLIDQQLDGRGVRAEAGPSHGQLVVDLAAKPRGALWTVQSWLLEEQARESVPRSRAAAEVLLRGAPELARKPAALRALALSSMGLMPLTPDGKPYQLTPAGVRDPERGTRHAPRWPALPVAGSPAARLLQSVGAVRSALSFDDEGRTAAGEPMRSLRVTLTLRLRR